MRFEYSINTPQEYVDTIAAYLPLLLEIQDEDLKQKIAQIYVHVLQDCKWERVEDACFNPHFQQQKLIDHIRVTTGSAYAAAKLMNTYQGLELDLNVVLGLGLLHDVSKFLEFEPDPQMGAKMSSLGNHIQHGVVGAYYAKQVGLSEEWLQLIISHTPQSNNRPCRKEGFMFGLIDLADADQIAMAYDPQFPLFYDKL